MSNCDHSVGFLRFLSELFNVFLDQYMPFFDFFGSKSQKLKKLNHDKHWRIEDLSDIVK